MITSIYAASLAFILIFLSIKIIKNRRFSKIALGDKGEDILQRKIRAHGNFIEYTPLFLILLFLVEVEGLNKYFIHIIGATYVIGRISHAYGIIVAEVSNKNYIYRQTGMVCTFLCLASLAAILLIGYFSSLLA